MNNFVSKLNSELNIQLQSIDLKTDNLIEKHHKSFECVTNALNQLKAFLLKYNFPDEMEEILFFKKLKPELYSKSIYYKKITEIESYRPIGCHEEQIIYLKGELKDLTTFFNKHKEFYRYYRMKSNHFDDRYFVRKNINFVPEMKGADFDENFSTSHDYFVAKIMAHDQLEIFLNEKLEKIYDHSKNPHVDHLGVFSEFKWTGNKISLYELIYALQCSGVLNNGNCEINDLATLFEQAFCVQLDDIYRGFQDIKLRSNPTKFLDTLKESLLRKINEDFE